MGQKNSRYQTVGGDQNNHFDTSSRSHNTTTIDFQNDIDIKTSGKESSYSMKSEERETLPSTGEKKRFFVLPKFKMFLKTTSKFPKMSLNFGRKKDKDIPQMNDFDFSDNIDDIQ